MAGNLVKERTMSSPEHQSPVNPLPSVVVALFLVFSGVEIVFQLGARGLIGGPTALGWRVGALQEYAFSADIFGWMVENGRWPPEQLARLLTYLFIHGNFTQAAVTMVMLLALGKMVGERFSALATLALFIISGVVGALIFGLMAGEGQWLFGAMPGVYGWIGGFTFLLWTRLGAIGESQLRAFALIGFLIAIQLIFGLLFGGNKDWIADVCGFVTGFLLSFVLVPGGWQRVRDKIRHE
jgi:membrane associated rhomboid family serine protease